jgi:hypothetical protein
MGNDDGFPQPTPPDERRQKQLIAEHEAREQRKKELTAQILLKEGPSIERTLADEYDEHEPERRRAIAQIAAETKALELTQPGRIFPVEHHVNEFIPQAIAVQDKREAEQAASPLAAVEAPALVDSEQARLEQLVKAAQSLPVHTVPPAAPEPVAAPQPTRDRLLDSAKVLHATDDRAAATWVAQAESADRQRHQNGRYDALRKPPAGGQDGPAPSHDPLPSGPPNGPLSANEILGRFGNPEREARFQKQEKQTNEQREKAASTPDAITQAVVRGDGLLVSFVTPATRKKVELEQEARAFANVQSFGRKL